jgi:hypothetical protein
MRQRVHVLCAGLLLAGLGVAGVDPLEVKALRARMTIEPVAL